MDTYPAFPEPSYVQESFAHILATFKILDASCDNTNTVTELNVTVEYRDEGFYITNNEAISLCEVELFVDYTDDDLSTGYHCNHIVGIPPSQSGKIQNFQFEDNNGNMYVYYPRDRPSK